MDSIRTAYSDQSNITHSSATRKTIDGRRLTYTLNVLQQPEKARACGNGAKASADRRPVDPPPVVELRVFEGEDDNNLKDITTSYHNVNFFLFATLEQRPVANGRIQTPGPPSVAVLNGCNVAGINYLERPAPAGYFIFPDLSVRHEGHYRLTFGLYEQVKDPRDADPENPFPTQEPGQADRAGAPSKHNSSVQRLEVRSEEFQVYSAKKFPGLDRSTGLSIGLSDQGCRVRIRRDVRMRKRPKAKANDQPIGGDPLRGRYANQEMSLQDRQRSLSHCSRDGSQYGERRLSSHSNDPYSHAAAPSLGAPAPLGGANFAVPTMPNTPTSALPPVSTYHRGPVPTAYPSPVAAPPARAPDYVQPPSPYRPYEHRASDASTVYTPSDSRRPSEATSYHRPSDAAMYRLQEPASYRPQESATYRPQEAYRPQEPAPYRQEPAPYRYSEPSRYQPADREPYRPSEPRHYATPAHYSYGPDDKRVTIIPEKPLLPSVHELIHASDMRSAEQMQPGKRAYSPPRWTSDSLKRGMRPSISHDEPETPFPGILEYKRANGTTTQAPGGKGF